MEDIEGGGCIMYLYSGWEFGSSGTTESLAIMSCGHMLEVKAENGPPGLGVSRSFMFKPSGRSINSSSTSSSDMANSSSLFC